MMILEYVIFMLFVKKKFVSCYLILASLKFMVWIFEEVVDIGFRESDFCQIEGQQYRVVYFEVRLFFYVVIGLYRFCIKIKVCYSYYSLDIVK